MSINSALSGLTLWHQTNPWYHWIGHITRLRGDGLYNMFRVSWVCYEILRGSLAVLECGNYRTNTTVHKSLFHCIVLPDFPELAHIIAHIKRNTRRDSISSIVLVWKQFNGIRQRTYDDSQLQTCSQTLPSPPQASSPPPNVHRHRPTPHQPTSRPPTSRISLHRRDQLRTFTTGA